MTKNYIRFFAYLRALINVQRSLSIIGIFGIIASLIILAVPIKVVNAATNVTNLLVQKNVSFKNINSPYYIYEDLTIPKDVKIKFEPGSEIFFESGMVKVNGSLDMSGTASMPILIHMSQSARGFSVVGGIFTAYYTRVNGGKKFLESYFNSTNIFDHLEMRDVEGDSIPISVWQESSLTIKNSVFENIAVSSVINIFKNATLSVDSTRFINAGFTNAISVFGFALKNGTKMRTVGNIINSSFGGSTSTISSDSSTKNGIEVFSDALLEVSSSTFSNLLGAGVLAYANAEAHIAQSIFSRNAKGIESYNSDVTVSASEFDKNRVYGAVHFGGTFMAKDNWWGAASGPHDIAKNPEGKGDTFMGVGTISPWLTEKKKRPCCSSVLFIPGIKASRIYKKSLFGIETQLWEPSGNSDVKKLFLDKDGQPVDKTLYMRDIIRKTNIGYQYFDTYIYDEFVRALDSLEFKYSIRDWDFAAYDWRMSPNTIAVSGSRLATGEYKRMEDQITRMAGTSRTGKVTLIAHSYGGLVAKRFLSYMADRGKRELIDKIIFVAVPEEGSPSALFALLHGDDQDIGRGFMMSKQSARLLAENMPSAYALLPTVNMPLIYGLGSSMIATFLDMKKFILNEWSGFVRPVMTSINGTDTVLSSSTEIPIIGNRKVLENIEAEKVLYKNQFDAAFRDIEFYNIFGIGLPTVKSATYKQISCSKISGTNSVFGTQTNTLGSKYCGLNHAPNYTKLGDGMVLSGNTEARWGDKYVFNMNLYNADKNKNYSHANIISADPVVSFIMQVITDNIGYFQLPKYIIHYGGSRYENGNISPIVALNISQSFPADGGSSNKPTYIIHASDTLNVSAVDVLDNKVGVVIGPLDTNSDSVPVNNTSPNSSYGYFGNSSYTLLEHAPQTIHATPVHIPEAVIPIDIVVEKLPPEDYTHIPVNMTSETISATPPAPDPIFSFEGIPVNEYTDIEVRVDLSSSTPAILVATENIDNVYTETKTYLPTSIGGAEQPGNILINSMGGGTNSTQVMGSGHPQTAGGFADIQFIINSIRGAITKSSLRTNFKNRYLLKLKTIETYNKSTVEKTRTLARKASKETGQSLLTIIKELGKSRPLYYRGGLTRGEAIFLYSQFSKLMVAYGDL